MEGFLEEADLVTNPEARQNQTSEEGRRGHSTEESWLGSEMHGKGSKYQGFRKGR